MIAQNGLMDVLDVFKGYSGSFSYTLNNDTWKKWFGPKDDSNSGKDKNKGNENEALEQYDDENTDGEEEDRSGLRKTEAAAIDPDGYMAFKMLGL